MTARALVVPLGSRLRPDATLSVLRLAVTKALLVQMDSSSDWRDLAQLTETDQLGYSLHTDESLIDVLAKGVQWRDDDYDAAVRHYVARLLELEGDPSEVPGRLKRAAFIPLIEERLSLPDWLAANESKLHARLYAEVATTTTSTAKTRGASDLSTALAVFDRASANLERLQAVWDQAAPLLPSGPQLGSDPQYEDLSRRWDDLLVGIPPIDGFRINESLPEYESIGQAFLDYAEIGELPTALWHETARPGRLLDEYRHKLRLARSRIVRERVFELRDMIDEALPRLVAAIPAGNRERVEDERAEAIRSAFLEIMTLVGDSGLRKGRWGDFSRHLRFGQPQDWKDILEMDWPSVRAELDNVTYGHDEPLPIVDGIDLGQLSTSRPVGSVSTEYVWSGLTSGQFEQLLYDLFLRFPDYENVQHLMRENAPDKGRDVSAVRVIKSAGNFRQERVMIQAKHWQSKSVTHLEVQQAVADSKLWGKPVVRGVVIATTGAFTANAVDFAERHNDEGLQPYIDLWSETILKTILSEFPDLIAQYKLRKNEV